MDNARKFGCGIVSRAPNPFCCNGVLCKIWMRVDIPKKISITPFPRRKKECEGKTIGKCGGSETHMVRAYKAGFSTTSISKNRSMMPTNIVKCMNFTNAISAYHIFHISQSAMVKPRLISQKSVNCKATLHLHTHPSPTPHSRLHK